MDFSIKISATNTARYSIDNCGPCGLSRGVCLYYLGNETIPHSKNFVYHSYSHFLSNAFFRNANISSCYSNCIIGIRARGIFGFAPLNCVEGVGSMNFKVEWNGTAEVCLPNLGKTYTNATPGYYSVIPDIIIRASDAAPKTSYVNPQIITVCGPEMEFQNISGNIYMKEHFIGKYNNQPASIHVLCYYYNSSGSKNPTFGFLNFTLTTISESWNNINYQWDEFRYAI
jgi:hypothetical protein